MWGCKIKFKLCSTSCRNNQVEDIDINSIPDPPEDVPDFPTQEEQIEFLRQNPQLTANVQVVSYFLNREKDSPQNIDSAQLGQSK